MSARSKLVLLPWLACACSSQDVPPALFTPYMPPAPAAIVPDTTYAQEINHPFNGDPPLIAVIDTPFAALDKPTAIAQRGWISRENGAAVVHDVGAELIDAAASSDAVFLASTSTVFELGDDLVLRAQGAPGVHALYPGRLGVHVVTGGGYGFARKGAPITWVGRLSTITAIHETDSAIFVASGSSVSRHTSNADGIGAVEWTLPDAGVGVVRAIVADVSLPRQLDLVVIGEDGIAGVLADGTPRVVPVPEFATGRVPLAHPRKAVKASDGGFIVTTSNGAERIMDRGDGPEWRVYPQERWLASEDVRGVLTRAEVDSPVWFATAGGLSEVTVERMTIEKKLEHFVERIKLRHDREGAVADSHLLEKGNLATNIPWDSDNDGSWTSYWLMAECFRWKVTQAPDAKANFDKSLEAMLRLHDVTGTDYFLARSIIRKEGCMLDDCDNPDDGKWYSSPDDVFWVKRDTSNDEVIAHAFMMGHAYDLCADEPQKVRIRNHIAAIVGGIIDHGFQLIDPITNLVTTYGQFEPAYVNDSLPGLLGDGGQRSAMILSELTLAYYLTGDAKFADAKKMLMEQHHYDENAIREAAYDFRPGVGDGDEMSTYAWFLLLRYEPDPALRARWLEGWKRTHQDVGKQQGAWWDMVNAVVGGEDLKVERARRWLRHAPYDMVRWSIRNSMRLDLVPAPVPYEDGGSMRSDGRIIPYDERPCDRWNTDQFKADGGFDGSVEMDGADVLAPYWMARYYGFIGP